MAYSMQTEIDTLYSKKHSLMSFVEFLEAISRVANDYSPYPVTY